jgi:hypothetical protein
LVTWAVRLTVPDVAISNADGDTDTAIGRIVIGVLVADFVGSPTDIAVIVTVPPGGDMAGAVYVVSTPLCVCARLKDPQTLAAQGTFGVDARATLQLTPWVLMSLVIAALTPVVPPTARVAGVDESVTAMGRLTILMVTLEVCDGSLETRDVIVMVLSVGIRLGAV